MAEIVITIDIPIDPEIGTCGYPRVTAVDVTAASFHDASRIDLIKAQIVRAIESIDGDFIGAHDSINKLGLKNRTVANLTRYGGIHTIGQLVGKTEQQLARITNIGINAINEIKVALRTHGLFLHED